MRVLVVVARGLRLAAVGCYGNQWVETSSLDRLAAEGVVFDQHFADRADPEGARRAWRSGRYHLPGLAREEDRPPGEEGDLLDGLRGRGVHTRLIVDASRPAPAGFEAGWDEVERVEPAEGESGLEATVGAARAALEGLAGRDGWLLWVDLGTPLPPWEVPEEFLAPYFEEEPAAEEEEEEEAEEEAGLPEPIADITPGEIDPADDGLYLSLQSSYAAAVTYLDAGVGQLLEALAEVEGADEVLVLFTTDCGQALGEHGVVGAVPPYLHEEIIHLPLLLRLPRGAGAGRHVAALTQAVDVGPTLAEAFGVSLPGAQGHSLLPLARGEAEQVRAYACAGLRAGGAVAWALRTPDWGFLLPLRAEEGTRGPQFYVKPDDRWEVNNVVQHHLEWSDHLEQTLRAFVSATARAGPLEVPPLPWNRPGG